MIKKAYNMKNVNSILVVGNSSGDITDFLDLKLRGISLFSPPRVVIVDKEKEAAEMMEKDLVSLVIVDGRSNSKSTLDNSHYSDLIETGKLMNIKILFIVSDYVIGKKYDGGQMRSILLMPVVIEPDSFYPIIDRIEKMLGCECSCRV